MNPVGECNLFASFLVVSETSFLNRVIYQFFCSSLFFIIFLLTSTGCLISLPIRGSNLQIARVKCPRNCLTHSSNVISFLCEHYFLCLVFVLFVMFFFSCSSFHLWSVLCLCCPVSCLLYSLAKRARFFEDLTVGEFNRSMRI